jgi:hypothetical protein
MESGTGFFAVVFGFVFVFGSSIGRCSRWHSPEHENEDKNDEVSELSYFLGG